VGRAGGGIIKTGHARGNEYNNQSPSPYNYILSFFFVTDECMLYWCQRGKKGKPTKKLLEISWKMCCSQIILVINVLDQNANK
jgi:hypothetical protein